MPETAKVNDCPDWPSAAFMSVKIVSVADDKPTCVGVNRMSSFAVATFSRRKLLGVVTKSNASGPVPSHGLPGEGTGPSLLPA